MNLDQIMKEVGGKQDRRNFFSQICRGYNPQILHKPKKGRYAGKCDLLLSEKEAKHFITVARSRKQKAPTDSPGFVYCFLGTSWIREDGEFRRWCKVGRSKSWEKRKRSYSGPTAIDEIIGVRWTENMNAEENRLLALFDAKFTKKRREWFIVPAGIVSVLKKMFQPKQ